MFYGNAKHVTLNAWQKTPSSMYYYTYDILLRHFPVKIFVYARINCLDSMNKIPIRVSSDDS